MIKVGLIPSRYASSRFPGKPLQEIQGFPMFVHVYYRSKLSSLDKVFVCTDDERIYKIGKDYKVDILMTSPEHKNGTERCFEASNKLNIKEEDIVLDIQGDEPVINPRLIDDILDNFNPSESDICFPSLKLKEKNDVGSVKVVTNTTNRVLYMSRADIPHPFRENFNLKKQIGLIAFTGKSLKIFNQTPCSTLENVEGVELLRAFDSNLKITTFETRYKSKAVDYLEDVEFVDSLMERDTFFPLYKDQLKKLKKNIKN